jgi:hypothetical protein
MCPARYDSLRSGDQLVATRGDTQISLSWVHPDRDFAGTMIRFSTAGFPAVRPAARLLRRHGTSTTHTGLTNGADLLTYTAFAYDAVQ